MSLSPILLANTTVKQPTTIREYRVNIQNDNTALDGSVQRNRVVSAANPLGYKYVAELTWNDLGVTDFQTILGLITTGSGILYTNPNSKYGYLSYSGLPMVDEPDPYLAGDSLLDTFKVTLRQI